MGPDGVFPDFKEVTGEAKDARDVRHKRWKRAQENAFEAALQAEASKELVGAPVGGGDPAAGREVTVLADKGLPYAMLKKIMASCSAADYRKVSLAVIEKERAYAGPNPV